jgi:hypothetical protein
MLCQRCRDVPVLNPTSQCRESRPIQQHGRDEEASRGSRPALAETNLSNDSSRHLVKLVNLARSLADFVEETPR